jgi:hypothetical protein
MDTTRFDAMARNFARSMTRRQALRGLVAGAAAITAGGTLSQVEDASARRRRRRRRRRNRNTVNVCAGKNWCVDRTQTCGATGGYGKCLEDESGSYICVELLFQVASCSECWPANCTDCSCVPAVGSDKCNNGANGYDFVCVRKV